MGVKISIILSIPSSVSIAMSLLVLKEVYKLYHLKTQLQPLFAVHNDQIANFYDDTVNDHLHTIVYANYIVGRVENTMYYIYRNSLFK